jgi:predicted DNA-binding ribbon-helix-helix protein
MEKVTRKFNWSTVSLELSTLEQLQYLAEHSNMTTKALFKELVDNVFQIAGMMKEGINFSYEISALERSVKIIVSGKSRNSFGSIGQLNVPNEIKEKLIENEKKESA